MRSVLFIATTSGVVALGGCLLSYENGAYDNAVGWGGGGGGASTSSSGTGGTGGMSGPGGAGGMGGTGGASDCAICDVDSTTCDNKLACPSLGWSDRWGAAEQQRVLALTSNASKIALAGEFNGASFLIGRGSPRTVAGVDPLKYEAYVALLDGDGLATWASAIGVGSQPRSAQAVAFVGNDVVVAGSSASAEGNLDAFVLKFAPNDSNQIGAIGSPFLVGGDGDDKAVAIGAGPMGDFYVVGKITASSKAIPCGMDTNPKNGMFVAGFTSAATCKWFVQAEGDVEPTALVYDVNNLVRVVGHFSGTLKVPGANPVTAADTARDSFVLALSPNNGATSGVTTIKAYAGGAVRAGAAVADAGGTVYVTGQLQGKTEVEPDRVDEKQTAAFVMASRAENAWTRVFLAGDPAVLEYAVGTSLAVTEDGSLYVGGTFKNVLDIDPASPSGAFARDGVNPFLARLDTTTGTVSWIDVYDGKKQASFTKYFYVTTLGQDVVLAGNWLSGFDFSADGTAPLSPKGNGTDEDIIAAKITP